MTRSLVCVLGMSLGVSTAWAQRAASPADATVFIRLTGNAHVEVEEIGQSRRLELERVQLGSGSGFVISPQGHILTNQHVIGNSTRTQNRPPVKTTVSLEVTRIEACFPRESIAARAVGSRCVDATVMAADAELDLAVLSITAPTLPYVALGDSDAVTRGQPVQALGYPLGNDVEVGRTAATNPVPDISAESGTVSALRAGDNGERRFLQISSNLNPGNSGGPLVDEEGFAVGVIRMRLVGATGIGFAIPIEQAKDFLERRGLDGVLPARRLRLGAFQTLRDKGLGLRLPDVMDDASPLRARVESDPRASDVALRIDRVLTPLTPAQIEQSLVQTQQFEQSSGMAMASRRPEVPRAGPTRLVGRAIGGGTGPDQGIAMLYTVLDLRAEALVARYVGPAEQLAFNASVLRDSLASLDGQALRAAIVEPVAALKWESMAVGGSARLTLPAGWVVEPGSPTACQGLKPAAAAVAAFAPRDFTMALRVAVWNDGPAPEAVASACSSRRGTLGQASYALRAEWMAVQYVIEGVVARVGGQVVQAEVIAAEDRAVAARAVLAAWLTRARE